MNLNTNSSSTTLEEKKLFDDFKVPENDVNLKNDITEPVPLDIKLSNEPNIILDKSFEKDKCFDDNEEINFKRKSLNMTPPILNLDQDINKFDKTKNQILLETNKKNIEEFKNYKYKIIKSNKISLIEFSGKNKNLLKTLGEITKTKFNKYNALFSIVNSLLAMIAISIVYYCFSTKYYLLSLFLPLNIYVINKFNCYFYKSETLFKEVFEENKSIFKISSLYKESKQEILGVIYDLKNYSVWFKNLDEIKFDIIDETSVNFIFSEFCKQKGTSIKEDIKLRKVQIENGLVFLNEKTDEIKLAIFIESQILNNRNNSEFETKISICIPYNLLINFKSKTIAKKFIKSISKSLDYLNFHINNVLNSNKSKIEVPHSSDFLLIDKSEIRSKKPSLTVSPEIKEISQTTKQSDFKLTPINEANLVYYKVANSLIQELENYKKKEWKEMEKKRDYVIYYFDEVSGFRSCKAEAVLNKNIKHVYSHMLDLSIRGEYDKNFDHGNVLEYLEENLSILYLKFKGKWPVSARDFTVLQYTEYVI